MNKCYAITLNIPFGGYCRACTCLIGLVSKINLYADNFSSFLAAFAQANNTAAGNSSHGGLNPGLDFIFVNFDIAWKNSWRTSTEGNNYHGASIFLKFRKKQQSIGGPLPSAAPACSAAFIIAKN